MSPDLALDHLLRRAADPDQFERWIAQARSARFCTRPVRLRGSTTTVDGATGEVLSTFTTADQPDGILLKACGQRRLTACPECAEVYRVDAWHLIASGLRGGKGVPGEVADHPLLFVTLTAPSFGPVHSRRQRNGRAQLCRPGQPSPCGHGRPRTCEVIHDEGDQDLGEPLCPDCYDYCAAVLWNAQVTELWRRTRIRIERELAHAAGVATKDVRDILKLSYAKVVEYQARGTVHLHVVLRLDGPDGPTTPPPAGIGVDDLELAVHAAAPAVTVPPPLDDLAPARWGTQLTVDRIDTNAAPAAAVAAYIAKYATKSTDAIGQLDHKLDASTLPDLDLPPHLRRMVETAWDLGGQPALASLRLRDWAHTLGFRGHWLTKSRQYSTTLTRIRGERSRWARQKRDDGPADVDEVVRLTDWRFAGRGWSTPGDAALAQSGAEERAQVRGLAREARRTGTER